MTRDARAPLRIVSLEDDLEDALLVERASLAAAFGFPVGEPGRLQGVIEVFSRRPEPPDPELLGITADLGRAIGRFLERRDAEERLRESQERFRVLSEEVPEILFVARPDGLWEYVNGRFLTHTGLAPEAALREGWIEALHPDDRNAVRERWKRSMAAGEPFEAEFRLRRADGAYRWFLGRGVPLRDGEGRVSRWLGVATDIDDQRRARDRQAFLTEASATLASSLEFETTLASVSRLVVPRLGDWCVVHLLRENGTLRHVGLYHRDPARVRLVEEMLALHPLDPDLPYGYPKVLRTGESQLLPQITGEMVRAAARQMDALTRDLLALARIGRTSLEVRPIDPTPLLREILAGMQEEIAARGAQVALEEPFPSVRGDRLLLGQALQNFLSNAVKFVAPGVPPRVRVRAERRDGRVRLWVEDNGIGILREYWDRVFRLFERLHTAQEYPGTGVGLAIVQKAADRMGGRVGVESEPGKGSRFWIELPAG